MSPPHATRTRITEIVDRDVLVLAPSTSLRRAAAELRQANTSFAAVGEGDRIDGVVSERDLVEAIADERNLDLTDLAAIESVALKWAAADATVDDVAEEMLDSSVRHVLVCDSDGKLLGVASMRELLRAYRS